MSEFTKGPWDVYQDSDGNYHIQEVNFDGLVCSLGGSDNGDMHTANLIAAAPEMYDDIWVAGKCMYKLEPVVADGGELIIYAPHIDQVSTTHGDLIKRIGYHTRDYFTKQMEKFEDIQGEQKNEMQKFVALHVPGMLRWTLMKV